MTECLKHCIEAAGWGTALAWAAGLAAALLPSLLTAVTARPTAGGWRARLMALVDVLSVLSHKDAHGTLKLPGKRSKPAAPAAP